MRIVFMSGGAREAALRCLLEHGENVAAVITPLLSKRNNRFEGVIKTAAEFGVAVFPVTPESVTDTLKKISYEILLSCGFPYILTGDSLATARHAINVHPTLLPKYRGYRSGPYVILNGEKESGVTVHRLTVEMDKGPILAQRGFVLSSFDTTKSVYRKCRELEPELVLETIRQLKSGECRETPQDERRATTYTRIRTPDDSEINPEKSLKDLYNEIRACDPDDYPAFFYVDGQKVCIKLWRPAKPRAEEDMI